MWKWLILDHTCNLTQLWMFCWEPRGSLLSLKVNGVSSLHVWAGTSAAGQGHLQAMWRELATCIHVEWHAAVPINLPTDPGLKSRHSHCVVLVSALASFCVHGRILCVHRWSFCLSSFRQPHWGDGYCYCLVPARIKFPPKTELKKKDSHTGWY